MEEKQKEPIKVSKKIGNAKYDVIVHFSETNKEDINDKIKRIVIRGFENEKYEKNDDK